MKKPDLKAFEIKNARGIAKGEFISKALVDKEGYSIVKKTFKVNKVDPEFVNLEKRFGISGKSKPGVKLKK